MNYSYELWSMEKAKIKFFYVRVFSLNVVIYMKYREYHTVIVEESTN